MAKEAADWANGTAIAKRNACRPVASSMDARIRGSTYQYASDTCITRTMDPSQFSFS
jgi:hypothetical protein